MQTESTHKLLFHSFCHQPLELGTLWYEQELRPCNSSSPHPNQLLQTAAAMSQPLSTHLAALGHRMLRLHAHAVLNAPSVPGCESSGERTQGVKM